MSLMVAAHCEMCPECSEFIQRLNEVGGEVLESEIVESGCERQFATIMDDILANDIEPSYLRKSHTGAVCEPTIAFDGKTFPVPRALSKFITKDLVWSSYLGRMSHANISIGGGNLAQFIFMESGAGVPEHTHKGNEVTLVLDGEFCDGLSVYRNGDLAFMNGSHKHTPRVETEEGCLVFSIIDQPLQFTNNWARIINPLSNLFFHANIDRR